MIETAPVCGDGERGGATGQAECAVVSPGAGVGGSSASLFNVGQVGAGASARGNVRLGAGVMHCLARVAAADGCPFVCGDIDGSGGNVDLVDFASFAVCFGGAADVSQACTCSDLDGDGTVNLLDFATFSLTFGGVSTNVAPNCP